MAAVPVNLSGIATLPDGSSGNFTFSGLASIAGLGVGGGPALPGQPPGYWGGVAPPLPTHPIAPGGPPPGIWPDPGHPAHPIAPGGPPPGIWPGPGYPAHPIAPGGQPPGYWGGVAPPLPTHPIAPGGPPPSPTFPIWGPPGVEFPPGSGYPPVAGHPLPEPPTPGAKPIIGWEAKVVWTEPTGWAVIIVPKDETTVPTPSQ